MAPAPIAARVRDLAYPAKNKSKFAPDGAPGVIRMLDSADAIRREVTDSDNELRSDSEGKPGLANLAEILAILIGHSPEETVASYGRSGELKDACVDAVIAELDPICRRYEELTNDLAELRRILARGAERASIVAEAVLQRAGEAIGIVGSGTHAGRPPIGHHA